MAFNNLAPPTKRVVETIPGDAAAVFQPVTGIVANDTFVVDGLPSPVAATTLFVQQNGIEYGIHVDTIQRGPAVYTSVNPLYQFRTAIDAGGVDRRVFPFSRSAYAADAEIAVKFQLRVKRVSTRNQVSHAYGHPTIEFIDQRSGRHVYFTALAYGTVLDNDYLAPDAVTGKVIVGTVIRHGSPYIRNLSLDYVRTTKQFFSPNKVGEGGPFEFHMNRDEFRNVLASARTVYSALSAEPEDYLLDNVHFNNEVYGDGEIGLNLSNFRLEIVRR